MSPAQIRAAIRPRVEGDREAEILDAALALLTEAGYDRLTMDAVATRAKASKATLYRRWETKADLVMDAVVRAKNAPDVPEIDTGSLRGDLIATFCYPGGMTDQHSTAMLASVITALAVDEEFGRLFREKFLAPKAAVTQCIFARAQARGELVEGLDLELLGPALAGILLHRIFLLGEPVNPDVVEQVVDQIIVPAATGHPYRAGARPDAR